LSRLLLSFAVKITPRSRIFSSSIVITGSYFSPVLFPFSVQLQFSVQFSALLCLDSRGSLHCDSDDSHGDEHDEIHCISHCVLDCALHCEPHGTQTLLAGISMPGQAVSPMQFMPAIQLMPAVVVIWQQPAAVGQAILLGQSTLAV